MSATDASPPPALRREFWVIVALLNVALLGLALGVLLLVFRPWPAATLVAFAVGLLTLGSAWRRYRRVERRKA